MVGTLSKTSLHYSVYNINDSKGSKYEKLEGEPHAEQRGESAGGNKNGRPEQELKVQSPGSSVRRATRLSKTTHQEQIQLRCTWRSVLENG